MLTQYIWEVAGGFDLAGPGHVQTHHGTSLAAAALNPPVALPVVAGVPDPGTTLVITAPESTWWVWSDGANICWADPADLNQVFAGPNPAGDHRINLTTGGQGVVHFSIT